MLGECSIPTTEIDEPRTELRTVASTNVLIVAGPAASGKTTFATRLASRLSYSLFDLDQVTGPLVEQCLSLLGQPLHALDEDLGQVLRAARYEALLSAATANISLGRHAVIAAPFTREIQSPASWREMLSHWSNDAAPTDVRTELIVVQCPDEVLRERLARRGEARDLLKLESGAAVSGPLPGVDFHAIDGTMDTEDEIDRLVAALHLGLPRVVAEV